MLTFEQLSRLHEAPWNAHDWNGEHVSVDGTSVGFCRPEEVAQVLAYATTEASSWDGKMAIVLRMKDDRIVAWESWWDATGSGFCADAYGGEADVWYASDVKTAVSRMSESCYELIRDQLPEGTR